MVAVWAVDMAMIVVVIVVVVGVAIRAMNVGLLGHAGLLRVVIAGDYLTTARQVQVPMDE
jgi:hypothetical protein